jgi:hypothetical protein
MSRRIGKFFSQEKYFPVACDPPLLLLYHAWSGLSEWSELRVTNAASPSVKKTHSNYDSFSINVHKLLGLGQFSQIMLVT